MALVQGQNNYADPKEMSDEELDQAVHEKIKYGKPLAQMSDDELTDLVHEKQGKLSAASAISPTKGMTHEKLIGKEEGLLNALPAAGGIFGGLAGTELGPAGMMGGAGLGAAGGEYLANAGRTYLGLPSAPKTSEDIHARAASQGVINAGAEVGGQLLSSGIKAAGGYAKGILSPASKGIIQEAEPIVPSLKTEGMDFFPKDNVDEIQSAAKGLNIRPTRGMLTGNENLQNVESVLSQSPTMAGEAVRSEYRPIEKGLNTAAETIAPKSDLTKFSTGEEVKKGITAKIGEKLEPLSASYDNIRESARNINLDPMAKSRSVERLMSQDLAEHEALPAGAAIKKYSDMIANSDNLNSLKLIKSQVGDDMAAAYRAGSNTEGLALGRVKSAIERLERRSILSSAIENAPTKGKGIEAANDLISQIKQTNKGYRELMTQVQSLADAGRLGKITSPKHLLSVIEDIPSEQISEKMFNTKNFQGLQDIKHFIPEEFEALKASKLRDIAKSSSDMNGVVPSRLVRNLEKIGPEARGLLLGPNGEKMMQDMKTVIASMPEYVGPSGTPKGMAWNQFVGTVLSPQRYGQELGSAMSYMQLQGKMSSPSAGLIRDVGEIASSPVPYQALIQSQAPKRQESRSDIKNHQVLGK